MAFPRSYPQTTRIALSDLVPISENKLAKSSKFQSPPQADGVLRNFVPTGTDFVKARNPRSKLRGILRE